MCATHMVPAPTPEVNSLASAIKMLAVFGIFSLHGERRATFLHHRFYTIQLFTIIESFLLIGNRAL